MRWEIAKNMRCDLLAFTGINFSGKRTTMQIYPSSKKGDLEGPGISSLVVIAPYDTRVVLLSSVSETDWEQMAWRAIEIKKGVEEGDVVMLRSPEEGKSTEDASDQKKGEKKDKPEGGDAKPQAMNKPSRRGHAA